MDMAALWLLRYPQTFSQLAQPETSKLIGHRRVRTISFTLYFLSHFAGIQAGCMVVKYTAAGSYYIGHRHIRFSGDLCGSHTSASPCVSSACFSEFIVMHWCGQNITVSCGQLVREASVVWLFNSNRCLLTCIRSLTFCYCVSWFVCLGGVFWSVSLSFSTVSCSLCLWYKTDWSKFTFTCTNCVQLQALQMIGVSFFGSDLQPVARGKASSADGSGGWWEGQIFTKPCSWSEGPPKHLQLQLSVT